MTVFDASGQTIAELSLASRADTYLGGEATSCPGWLALTFYNRKSLSTGIQLVSVDGRSVTPAKVLHDDLTRAQRFELAYPGFLKFNPKRRRVRAWQLSAAIHQSLVDEGLATKFELRPFAAKHPTKKIDPEDSKLVKDAVLYVQFAAESGDACTRLKHLRYDPTTPELELELYPFFDGEDDTFAITDLRGVEQCSGLERFTAHLGTDRKKANVAPLAGLGSLEIIELDGHVAGLAALARAPKLKRLELADGTWHDSSELASLRRASPSLEIVVRS